MTRSLTINYDDDVLLALGMTPDEFSRDHAIVFHPVQCSAEREELTVGQIARLGARLALPQAPVRFQPFPE